MTTETVTQAQIEQEIMAVLPADGALMPWRDIRAQLPGGYWSQAGALDHLHEEYRVSVAKVRGRNYVRRASDWDLEIATAQRDRAARRGWPLPRCRDFAMA
ncbi:hypothetical protein [Mycobacteroides salmoniphilum]|uniref:hypothetical protein n=1 Tax=Mycobacteroides salmoniphilum TaxID=404941 RepID=UPI001066DED3|nr:hypothetical protein [Mycobacteroides salmoniphilum]TDZ77068.1 hypothetical protein DE4586_02854 [Mycobacteroides salmoniphilum]TDZ86771.1 hypothetical protein DE4587_02158 [Mycobacteroides salmoniphilum]